MIDLLRREENDLILLEILNAKKSIDDIFEKLLRDISLKFNQHQFNEMIQTQRRDDSTDFALNQIDENFKTEPIENTLIVHLGKNVSKKVKSRLVID